LSKKFLLLLALILLPFLSFAQVSSNFVGNVGTYPAFVTTFFTCNLQALVATLTEMTNCSASSTGQRYYVTGMAVQTTTATAGTFAVQQGTGTNCGTNTAVLFPTASTAARWTAPINTQPTSYVFFEPARRTNVNYALCAIGTGTNTINIEVWGYTAP